ncbi:alpha/beta hydrolase [Lapillicoccus jejuensis]
MTARVAVTGGGLAGFDAVRLDFGEGRLVGEVSVRPCAPAVLLLHGHPQTHLIWHHVAPALAEWFTVVALDLPGYGDSRPSDPGAAAMTKRAMASDLDEGMRRLGEQHGFGPYAVVAHDRGARVAHRLLADRPDRVTRALLMDIAPTLDMYEGTTRGYATAYWHWFFLIQREPLPERLVGADPDAYLDAVMGSRHAGLAAFDDEALAAYRAALRDPEVVHWMCEDYRASAGPDLELDRADREAGRVVTTPLRVLWGARGIVERYFDPLALWSALATDVSGRALDCGHYLPEEAPAEVLTDVQEEFLAPLLT